jgi:hypothetical protein
MAVRAVHKPGTKATVKKASAPKRVAKAAVSPAKTKQVATAKRRAPARQAAVSKPMPVAKRQPSTKAPVPSQPVLPRV